MSLFSDYFADSALPMLFDELGEPASFVPKFGRVRSITGIIERRGRVLREMNGNIESVEEIAWTVRRDPGHADGGIDAIEVGEFLQMPGDAACERYGWTGDIENESDVCWTLVFTRNPMVRQGGSNQTMQR